MGEYDIRASYSAGGRYVIAGSEGGGCYVWNEETGEPLIENMPLGLKGPLLQVGWSPTEHLVACCSYRPQNLLLLLTHERSEADAELAARLAQLTPQQFRVLLCLADGLLNKQIAATLGLAENTVKVHVTAILKKLECYSRTQAAVLVKSLETESTA